MTTKSKPEKLGWLPAATATLAFVACNGLFILVAIFAFFGATLVINPHIQAAAISLFAILTLIFVVFSYRQHHLHGPLIASIMGTILIVGSMYIYFDKIIESLGLIALIVSAIWSWRASKTCSQPVEIKV